MEKTVYKPDIYEGNDPFIYASFHQSDRERVLNILEKLDLRGFRFWIDDGIAPGMEADEIIAEHIENCDFFIAFLSKNYLDFLDTVDELNYSRDVNKDYLLIYLEDTKLPAGLDMRFMRSQNIKAYSMSDSEVYSQLLNIDGADRFYGITDINLRGSAEKVFAKLEKLYPEHKVFALDAVGKQVSKEISELYVKAGYPNAERLMLDYGFTHISTDEARSIRSSVLYHPGFEPDVVKPRIDYIMQTLSDDYPGNIITDVLSKSHKSIYSSLLGLSVWMGYESTADMLEAYGFTVIMPQGGRKGIDHLAVISLLEERYKEKEKPENITQLMNDNPDLKKHIKTLMNRAGELFGMTLLQYLKNIGLIVPAQKEEKPSKLALNRVEIIKKIKAAYADPNLGLGDFSDVEDTLNGIVVKKNKKEQVFVIDCSSCGETVNIPYGVDYIEKEAFAGQTEPVTLIIPPTVKEIRESAFSACVGLETIVFSDGIERIGNNAFEGCTSLKKIEFPKSLTAIGNEAFSGCEELADVTFNNYRVNIQEDAFDDCIFELRDLQDEGSSPSENFELKVDKKNIAKIVGYTGDEEIVVIPGMISGHPIKSIEKGCFKGNDQIREVYISDRITALNGDVFKNCRNLKKVHISESVTTFNSTMFAGCSSLSEVNIPNNMTEVTRSLFKDSPLTTLYVGKGTKTISPDAFYKGDMDYASGLYFKKKSLENLIIDTGNNALTANGTMLLSHDGKVLIAELGDPVKAIIPEGVEEIGAQAYDRLSSLTEILFPSTLKKIGEKAFAGTNLNSVELPPELEVIETQAFSFCRSLTALDINEKLKTIGQQAFEGCPIADVYIPASVEYIGKDSFLSISTYQGQTPQSFRVDTANIHIIADGTALYHKTDEGITLIKAYHPGLRLLPNQDASDPPIEYSIMDGTTSITAHAFARCNNLSSVKIPEGVVSIGEMAFWDCQLLKEVHIPDSCTEVSPKAFFGTSVTLI